MTEGEIVWLKAEVSRLNAAVEQLEAEKAFMASNDYVYSLISLIKRAADTLEEEFGEPTLEGQDLSQKSPWNLIIELRKAAQ